jgi:hypothetical protein
LLEDLVNLYDDFTKNERTQSLSRFAIENNFEFTKREPFGEQVTTLRNFKIFNRKGVKRFIGIVKIPCREGIDAGIRFYDYLVTKDLETKSTSVIEVYIPNYDCGQFTIKPKKAISRLFSPTFSKSNRAQFNRRFKIHSNFDLSLRSMNLMLSHPKLTVEGFQDTLLFYQKNKSINIVDILDYVDFAEEFISTMDSVQSEDFV